MFPKGLKKKFIVYPIPVIIFLSFSFLAFFIIKSNSLIKEAVTELGFSLVKSLSYSSEVGIASEDEIFLKPYFDKVFKEEHVVLVAIYNENGKIIISNTKLEVDEKIPEEVREEILKKRNILRRKNHSKTGEEFYDFYAPVLVGELLTVLPGTEPKELAGFARVGLSLEIITEQNKEILAIGLIITILLIAVGIFISFLMAIRLIKPINLLKEGADVIGRGELDYNIKIKTGDELEDLGKAFNQMAQNLKKSRLALEESREVLEVKVKARTSELKELAEGLEQKVKGRTKELQERIDELERFHRLTVGRELKMAELKKEIEKLKGREKSIEADKRG